MSDDARPWTIYCHTLTIDSRRYIGQTRLTVDARWKSHVAQATRRLSSNPFHSAIRRFTPRGFSHEALEVCTSQWDADKAEKKWIEKFDTTDPKKGFNLQSGGGGRKGPERRIDIKEDTPEELAERMAWVMALADVD